MSTNTLYTFTDSFRAHKVLIAAKYSKTPLTVKENDATVSSESFLSKFPLGRLPALETEDGLNLNDSNAIAKYVANDTLRGTNIKDASLVTQWMNFAENEIVPAMCTWVYPCLGLLQYNKQNTERAKDEVKAIMGILDSHLKTRTFLVGERVTLADITVATHMLLLYKLVLEPSFRQPYVHTNRWFMTVCNQPQFKEVVQVTLCEKMAQFDAQKYNQNMGKKDGGKKEKTASAKKEKPVTVKKEEAPAAPKEEAPKPPPEPKDPIGLLPGGSFNMDEFKRTITNKDFTTVALPYLLEKFDNENYSIWYSEYLYTDELTLTFMAANLIQGMYQRLEKLQKHCYACVCLFGEERNMTMSGLWFWRGTELAFNHSVDLRVDYESHSWKRLDFKAPETLELIKAYFGVNFPPEKKLIDRETHVFK